MMILVKRKNTYMLLITVLLFASCSVFSDNDKYPEWEEWQNTPESIDLSINIPNKVSRSSQLEYQAILTNTSNKTLKIGGGGSLNQTFELDLAVVNENEQMVWTRFPRDVVWTTILYTITLAPGESYTMEGVWNVRDNEGGKIPLGTYKIYAGVHGMEISPKNGRTTNFGPVAVGSEPFTLERNKYRLFSEIKSKSQQKIKKNKEFHYVLIYQQNGRFDSYSLSKYVLRIDRI